MRQPQAHGRDARTTLASAIPARGGRAFTLVEVMVVVGILVILMVIAIPVATGLLDSQRGRQTLATMDTLRVAIEQFADEAPIRGEGKLGTGTVHPYEVVFGRYPASPTSAVLPAEGWPSTNRYPVTEEAAPETREKFDLLVRAFTKYSGGLHPSPGDSPEHDDNTIECLVLFLNTFSPQASQTLQHIQASVMTNEDRDLAYRIEDIAAPEAYDADEHEAVDLFEVRDGWKRPMRYAVLSPQLNTQGQTVLPARWELRSAGADGQFAELPFTPEEESDDVVLRGPQAD